MKAQLALAFLLAGLGLLTAAAPALASGFPTCTGTQTSGGYSYTVTVTPCTSSGVALGSTVTLSATTNNLGVVSVEFIVANPALSTTTYTVSGTSPFSYSPVTLNVPGTWYVYASFCDATGTCFHTATDYISMTVSVLVLNELPIGTAAALTVSLVGLVAYTRIKKRPLQA
jgi:hypothetical protein